MLLAPTPPAMAVAMGLLDVSEGRLTIMFDDGPQHYKAGDAFRIPPGRATRHKVSQPLGQAAVVFVTDPGFAEAAE